MCIVLYRCYAFAFLYFHPTETAQVLFTDDCKLSAWVHLANVLPISQASQRERLKQSYFMVIYQTMFIGCTWLFNQTKIARHYVHSAMQHIWGAWIYSCVCVYIHFYAFNFILFCCFLCHFSLILSCFTAGIAYGACKLLVCRYVYERRQASHA